MGPTACLDWYVKCCPLVGIGPQPVQPIASCYTNYHIPAQTIYMVLQICFFPHPHTQKPPLIHVPQVAANTYALSLAKGLIFFF